jgi:formylglycine-generating enzyme required for sulfatase activity
MSASRFAALALALTFLSVAAQDVQYPPQNEQIPGPACGDLVQYYSGHPTTCSAADTAAWLEDVKHWRNERSIRVGIDQSEYDLPALRWTQSSFIQPQAMVHDRYLYDAQAQRYTVSRYLADVTQRYGGIDSVLVWHTYPNIGVDDRNQFDMFRDLPGGTAAVRQMVDDFHKQGVRVFFPVMVWDQGTRVEGVSDAVALNKELAEVGADGVNGDTLSGMPRTFRLASDAAHHPIALEPEGALGSEEVLNYNALSWGYWKFNFIPTISRYKWLIPRHMVHISDRWGHDHTDDLQHAFFNGIGFESWENVWGIWNGLTPRDAESVRRIATVERAFAPFLTSSEWEPHTPMLHFGIFASRWPTANETLWTIVNRNHYDVAGDQLRVPRVAGAHYYDVWHGVELTPRDDGNDSLLNFTVEADGYGAILRTTAATPKETKTLGTMQAFAEKPLSSYSNAWKSLRQQLVEIAPTPKTASQPAGGMVSIPAGDFLFHVNGIEIEGMNDEGLDVQYPWEDSARRYHEHSMHISAFAIDKYNVTNAEYKAFVDSSGYKPKDDHNYLRDWKNGTFPQGWAAKPVTWVSLEDARAYAAWAGKRLPHEWEWQYAAQGSDGRTYPWGNSYPTRFDGASVVPEPDKGRTMLAASDVNAHPAGASPFGVMDMVGNVWQWTDEYADQHTRAAIVRGGNHYQPQGARWYFPQAYKLQEHGKYLLIAPGMDRSGGIGFRCVRDE